MSARHRKQPLKASAGESNQEDVGKKFDQPQDDCDDGSFDLQKAKDRLYTYKARLDALEQKLDDEDLPEKHRENAVEELDDLRQIILITEDWIKSAEKSRKVKNMLSSQLALSLFCFGAILLFGYLHFTYNTWTTMVGNILAWTWAVILYRT